MYLNLLYWKAVNDYAKLTQRMIHGIQNVIVTVVSGHSYLVSFPHQSKTPGLADTWLSHSPQRTCRNQHKQFFLECPQALLESCFFIPWSVGASCPVQARTHHSSCRTLFCSPPNLGKSQPSRPISFVSQSTLHRLFFGHSKHQKGRHHLD